MSDYEIEYLDEDEDLVHKCVELIDNPTDVATEEQSLLVRRSISADKKDRKRSLRKRSDSSDYEPMQDSEYVQENDSDYDPDEEERKLKRPKRPRRTTQPTQTPVKLPSGPKSSKTAIKPFKHVDKDNIPQEYECKIPIRNASKARDDKIRQMRLRQTKLRQSKLRKAKLRQTEIRQAKLTQNLLRKTKLSLTNLLKLKPNQTKKKPQLNREKIIETLKNDERRRLHDIKLYDFEDSKHFNGIKVLNSGDLVTKWNQLCTKQEKEMQEAKSCRSVQYLRKVRTTIDGDVENVIRLHYEYRVDGKHFNFQGILPRFRPLQEVNIKFTESTRTKGETFTLTTIVTREAGDKSDILVAYCAKDFRVMTFEGCRADSQCSNDIRVLMSCKMCVKCYQYSWRGCKSQKGTIDIKCTVCGSTFTSAYNLLTHIRNHKLTKEDKVKQNAIFSQLMGYHYNCRLCKYKAESIPELRRHLKYHRSHSPFYCEVGKHFTT